MVVEKFTRAGRLGAALLSDAILFRREARHGLGSFSIIGHNVAFVVARPGRQVSRGSGTAVAHALANHTGTRRRSPFGPLVSRRPVATVNERHVAIRRPWCTGPPPSRRENRLRLQRCG